MAQATLIALDAAHARAIITPSYTGADTTPAVAIQRTEDAGQTWLDVRGDLADGHLSMLGGTARQFPDYEIPFDTPVQYRTIKADLDGNTVGSTFNLSATVVLVSTPALCLWWVHATDDPTLLGGFMPVVDGGAKLGADRGVQYGNNAVYPIIAMGARQKRSNASFTLVARTNTEALDIEASLGVPSVLCIRSPLTHGWARRFVVVLDIQEAHPNPLQAGAWLYRCSYVEAARPTNRLEVYGATYDQLAAAYTTYSALAAAYGTYDDQALAIIV